MSERTDNVVKLRRAYDNVIADVLNTNDPDGAERAGDAATAWLNAENDLSTPEFLEYQADYERSKK